MPQNLLLFCICVILLTCFPIRNAWGYPDGSPVCVVGTYAPDPNAHRFPFGGLEGRYQITIGGAVLKENEVLNVPSGVDLPFVISTIGETEEFKGVLAIVNNPNIPLLNSLLPNSSDVKVQEQCPPLGYSGFTHVLNRPKRSVEGILRLNTDVEAFIDVNIVVINWAHASVYFYSRYKIASFGIPPVPVPVPIPVPVPVPIPVPVPVPVTVPVSVPVPVPLPVPVPVPVPIPAPVPVVLPVPVPVPAAVLVPIPVPVPSMTGPVPIPSPISRPNNVPVPVPVPIPVPPVPVKIPVDDPTLKPSSQPTYSPGPHRKPSCGLFGLSIFCIPKCGFLRQLLNLC